MENRFKKIILKKNLIDFSLNKSYQIQIFGNIIFIKNDKSDRKTFFFDPSKYDGNIMNSLLTPTELPTNEFKILRLNEYFITIEESRNVKIETVLDNKSVI